MATIIHVAEPVCRPDHDVGSPGRQLLLAAGADVRPVLSAAPE
ncbi:hypothetical protein [Luteipulveratus mongoliensis]